MVAKQHHYLSRCYLKGFSHQKRQEHYVYTYDRSGSDFTPNIKGVAQEKDFNRVDLEGHAPDAFEQGIAKFEDELAPALLRILEARSIRDQNDRGLLFNLIAMAATRNPQQRETTRSFQERLWVVMLDAITATKERWERHKAKMVRDGFAPPTNATYEQVRATVGQRYRIEIPTERHIMTEMDGMDAVLRTLDQRNWLVLKMPANSPGFVTCDQPAVLMFSKSAERGHALRQPGHGVAGTQLIFPVGRGMAVVGAFELREGELDVSEENVASVNGAMVAFAARQVYAPSPDCLFTRQYSEAPRPVSSLVSDDLFLRREGGDT